MSRTFTICDLCSRRESGKDARECEAFPDGIPPEISRGYFDHRESYPGDNGIRFEPCTPMSEEDQERFFGKLSKIPSKKPIPPEPPLPPGVKD
ncbi:MAG: hypothetical protein EOM02_02400 [Synergistales bacterium]|nr:hypothetical protein [Synergistales bacterium]